MEARRAVPLDRRSPSQESARSGRYNSGGAGIGERHTNRSERLDPPLSGRSICFRISGLPTCSGSPMAMGTTRGSIRRTSSIPSSFHRRAKKASFVRGRYTAFCLSPPALESQFRNARLPSGHSDGSPQAASKIVHRQNLTVLPNQ